MEDINRIKISIDSGKMLDKIEMQLEYVEPHNSFFIQHLRREYFKLYLYQYGDCDPQHYYEAGQYHS